MMGPSRVCRGKLAYTDTGRSLLSILVASTEIAVSVTTIRKLAAPGGPMDSAGKTYRIAP
jgi:hypothetical protein